MPHSLSANGMRHHYKQDWDKGVEILQWFKYGTHTYYACSNYKKPMLITELHNCGTNYLSIRYTAIVSHTKNTRV